MKNILIVEDEKFVRQGIKTMIERSGFCSGEIVECKNGLEALEAVKMRKFNLILTDIKMPNMDGLTFIKNIKEQAASTAYIVIISGYDDFSFAVEAMRYGAREYLLKPIERENFYSMLKNIKEEIEASELHEVLVGAKEGLALQEGAEADKRTKIEKAVKYIMSNYKSDLNMAVVSNFVSMNYTFFSEAFKEITGESFVDFVKSVRINVAKELLKTTNVKVGKISIESGFKDEKHFLKTFKTATGFTPTDYRGKHQGGKK